MHKPTDEQAVAVSHASQGRSLVIQALAGAGKTSTLKLIANTLPRSRMLYTSFGAKNVGDAKTSMPRNVACKTNHGMAYAALGAAYRDAGRLNDKVTARGLAQHFGWTDRTFAGADAATGAWFVLQTLGNYMQSADEKLAGAHVVAPRGETAWEDQENAAAVLRCARLVWSEWENLEGSRLPITHDVYLKRWALSQPRLNHDIILLDEAQDSTPLIIDLLQRQKHAQLIVVGDSYQQIYSWRGAVNAMEAFDVDAHAALTQSFRFGQIVGDAANVVLESALGAEVKLRGTELHDTVLGPVKRGTQVARTNLGLIDTLASSLESGLRCVVVGGTADLSRLIASVEALQAGRPGTAAELQGFANWDEVRDFAKTPPGADVSLLCKLIDNYGTPTLARMLEQVPTNPNERDEEGADVVLTTAHKSKGREWDHVALGPDFAEVTQDDIDGKPPKGSRWTPEQSRLLYVAVTRAQKTLDLVGCTAWHSHYAVLAAQKPEHPLVQPSHPLAGADGTPIAPQPTEVATPRNEPAPSATVADSTSADALTPLDAVAHAAHRAVEAMHRLRAAVADLPDGALVHARPDVLAVYREARGVAEAFQARTTPTPAPPRGLAAS